MLTKYITLFFIKQHRPYWLDLFIDAMSHLMNKFQETILSYYKDYIVGMSHPYWKMVLSAKDIMRRCMRYLEDRR